MVRKILSVAAGFVAAFAVMMAFEFVNSLIFPLPKGMNIQDSAALKAFTLSMPPEAFIMVLLGYISGSLVNGFLGRVISKSPSIVLPLVSGVVLTAFGAMNFMMIGHPAWVVWIGAPTFLVLTLVGWWIANQGGKKAG